MRHFKLRILTVVVQLALAGLMSATAAPLKPNLIVILTDDLGYGDIGCYGATHVKTPHLDRLAREGMCFKDAHATASVCTPTRYAMLTGGYAWRKPGTGIAPGDKPALIKPGNTTVATVLKKAGYVTGVVGKWHLGLGAEPKTDFNGVIKPGPLEIGFDYAFLIPATGDRVPCVFVENHHVVGLNTNDPIAVSYGKRIGSEPVATDAGVKLKMRGAPGHDEGLVNGIGRIGYMTGGQAARWVDEDIADTLAGKALRFIETNSARPFFLYLSTHDIHEPMVPHPRFRGSSDCGSRGDVIQQLDWTVGEVLTALDRLNLSTNTLIVFTSDNGGAIKDAYDDGTNPLHARQKPNGNLRGAKSSLHEGGHRVPWIARWPGQIPAGRESAALIGTVDILATFAALTGQKLSADQAPDSFDILPALLGKTEKGRDELVLQKNGGASPLALRRGDWVLLEKGGKPKQTDKATANAGYELYNLAKDISQKQNLAESQPQRVGEMSERLRQIRATGHTRPGFEN